MNIPLNDKEAIKKNYFLNSQTIGCGNWFKSMNKRKAKLKALHIKKSRKELRVLFNKK